MDRKRVKALASEDRISSLPNDIIHHILSSFSTIDVVRLGILSKRWKHLSDSVPFLYFTPGIKKFCKGVNTCLKRREIDLLNATNSPISRFMLVRKCYARNNYIDRCLNFVALCGNLKEVNLEISLYSRRVYSLPQCILNMRWLTILKLRWVSLEGIVSVDLPSLISFELKHGILNDPELSILLSGCTSIQKLLLTGCFHPNTNHKISSSTLKSLEIIASWAEFQIEAINLESLLLQVRSFNLLSFGKIRKLSLKSIDTISGGMIEDLILQLPLLEYLDISYCSKIENLTICKQNLKHFVFIGGCCPVSVITIDAPNLVSIRLFHNCIPFKFSLKALNILDADINICGVKPYDYQSNRNLLNFLSEFDISKQLRLRFRQECINFSTEFRRIQCAPFPTLKHLKIIPYLEMPMSSDLKETILWLAPSATVSMEDSKFYFLD